jgi:hypothetical protein
MTPVKVEKLVESVNLRTFSREAKKTATPKSKESELQPDNPSITSAKVKPRLTSVSLQKEQPIQLSQVKVIDKAELTHQAHQEGKHEPREEFARTVDSSKEVPINDIPWKKSRTSNLLVSTELDLSGANTSHKNPQSGAKVHPKLIRIYNLKTFVYHRTKTKAFTTIRKFKEFILLSCVLFRPVIGLSLAPKSLVSSR